MDRYRYLQTHGDWIAIPVHILIACLKRRGVEDGAAAGRVVAGELEQVEEDR